MLRTIKLLPLCAALLLLGACSSNNTTVIKRLDPAEVADISGRWNDTDSRLVAEEMIKDCLSRPWLAKAKAAAGKEPTVIVGAIRNQSHEHIATETFVEDLQRNLINSGEVDFVASSSERGGVREERLDQETNASEETRTEHGQETGANYMLTGVISTIVDREGGQSVTFYQTNLKLLNMKTNQIVWNGQKKIKKYVSRPAASW